MSESPYETAARIKARYAMHERTVKIGVIPRDVKVGKPFHGKHPSGKTALVRRSIEHDYAQFDDINHEHAFGWHQYPLNTFTEVKK